MSSLSLKDRLLSLNHLTVAKHCSCKEQDYHESNKLFNQIWLCALVEDSLQWHRFILTFSFVDLDLWRCTVCMSPFPPRSSSRCSRPHWDINRSSCVIMSWLCRYFRANPDCWGVIRDHLRFSWCLGWTFKPSWSSFKQAVNCQS